MEQPAPVSAQGKGDGKGKGKGDGKKGGDPPWDVARSAASSSQVRAVVRWICYTFRMQLRTSSLGVSAQCSASAQCQCRNEVAAYRCDVNFPLAGLRSMRVHCSIGVYITYDSAHHVRAQL